MGDYARILSFTQLVSAGAGNERRNLYNFSQRGNIKKVMRIISSLKEQRSIWKYSIPHAHSYNGAQRYARIMTDIIGKEPESIIDISPVVGLNAGEGALAISIMME